MADQASPPTKSRRGPPRWIWFLAIAAAALFMMVRGYDPSTSSQHAITIGEDADRIAQEAERAAHEGLADMESELSARFEGPDGKTAEFKISGLSSNDLGNKSKAELLADFARAENKGKMTCTPALAPLAPAERTGLTAVRCVSIENDEAKAEINAEFSGDGLRSLNITTAEGKSTFRLNTNSTAPNAIPAPAPPAPPAPPGPNPPAPNPPGP